MKQKVCTRCNKLKVLNDFYKLEQGILGKKSECKECSKKKQLDYYRKNKEKCNKTKSEWINKNREYYNKYHRQWVEKNQQHCAQYHKEWCKRKKDENSTA